MQSQLLEHYEPDWDVGTANIHAHVRDRDNEELDMASWR